ncbi:aminodeoxychorismate synthase component I [Spongiibacter sp. KMU-158]|uniref:aminodeoxychorismate synthase n=1 Tax=Spongiibacter pelagi TaxID=2760804 RepID=A0A927C3N5_9GAMM|nr:aminodeoxychorismate synthase component I [Spongiibacter pelagi]MBD2859227.1 aminodeoxychorismate synthase component I [Spongiibacter pelagi]
MSRLVRQALPYASDANTWLQLLADAPHRLFLDSARPFSERGRYDIISADPKESIPLNSIDYITNRKSFIDLEARIRAAISGFCSATDLPFSGGAIGLLSYELGEQRLIQRPQDTAVDFVGIYDWAIIIDHARQSSELIAQPDCQSPYLERIKSQTKDQAQDQQAATDNAFKLAACFQSNLEASNYQRAFERLQDYIAAGDCYQVNLTREFSAPFSGDPLTAYFKLRERAAAPFSCFFDLGKAQLLSLSPERFIAADHSGRVRTEPIKGTAPRSNNPKADADYAQRLLQSGKNRAENVMIVDLLRNDLGQCCVPGSIQADPLLELQSFRTVHHLVSTVSGQLKPGVSALNALLACFPGGSITGAPKHRAMEIIAELEPHRRSAYCGSVFYLSACGRMDSNIVIRSFLCQAEEIKGWAGGGIVADSNCEDEFTETEQKLGSLLALLESL